MSGGPPQGCGGESADDSSGDGREMAPLAPEGEGAAGSTALIPPHPAEAIDNGWPAAAVLRDADLRVADAFTGESAEVVVAKLPPAVLEALGVLLRHTLRGPADCPEHRRFAEGAVNLVAATGDTTTTTTTTEVIATPPPESEVHPAAEAIPQAMRLGAIVGIIAAHMAATGQYDARMRWGLHRMAVLLRVPWAQVQAGEKMLAAALLEKTRGKSAKGKGSAYRWLKIGAGVTIGAGVLVVTGGLAAPLLAAATAAVASAAGGVAAAAGLTSVAAVIAATAAQLSLVMTVPVITALFGVAGAGVAGSKVSRRTKGVDEVTYTNVRDDLLAVPPWVLQSPRDTFAYARGTGLAVPLGNRAMAQKNFETKLKSLAKKVVLCIDYALQQEASGDPDAGALFLLESHLREGEWVYAPPETLRKGESAVFAAKRCGFSTSVSGFVIYGGASARSAKVCCAFTSAILGGSDFKMSILSPDRLRELRDSDNAADDLFNETIGREYDWVITDSRMLDPTAGSSTARCRATFGDDSSDTGVFTIAGENRSACCAPDEASSARGVVSAAIEKSRVHTTLAFDNMSHQPLHLVDAWVPSGALAAGYPFPEVIPAGLSFVTGAHTTKFSIKVKGFALFSTVHESADGSAEALFILCSFSSETGASARVLRDRPTRGEAAKLAKQDDGATPEDAPCSAELEVTADTSGDRSHQRFQLREVVGIDLSAESAMEGLDVTVGVSGMTPHYDPRVSAGELQGLMWGSVLGGAGWYVRWEAALQAEFGEYMSTPYDYGGHVSSAAQRGVQEGLKNPTVASTAGQAGTTVLAATSLITAVALPLYAYQAATVIDHTYSLLVKKAREAGSVLGEMLLERTQGKRPATLIGSCLGANVIYYALQHLHDAGDAGKGLIENVFLVGGTMSSNPAKWAKCRAVVGGRLVNAFSSRDWMLKLMHGGLTASVKTPAGLARVTGVWGVENVDVGHLVESSIDHARRITDILAFIPDHPTPQTLALGAIPGEILPHSQASSRVEQMCTASTQSMHCEGAVLNRTSAGTLSLESAELGSGAWETEPVAAPLPPQHCGTLALSGRGACATLAYTLKDADGGVACRFAVKVSLPLLHGSAECGACFLQPDDPLQQRVQDLETGGEDLRLVHPSGQLALKVALSGSKLFVTLGDVADASDAGVGAACGGGECQAPDLACLPGRCPADFLQRVLQQPLPALLAPRAAAVVVRNRTDVPLAHCWEKLRGGCAFAPALPLEIPPRSAAAAPVSEQASLFSGRPKGVLCMSTGGKNAVMFAFECGGSLCSPKVWSESVPMEKASEDAVDVMWCKAKSDGRCEQVSWEGDYQVACKVLQLDKPVFVFTVEMLQSPSPSSSAAGARE